MKQKMLAALLALSMVMGTSLTVCAAETEVKVPDATTGIYGAELTGNSTVQVPTVHIIVPSALPDLVINPYQMSYTIGADAAAKTYKDPVVFVEQTITSKSNVPVAINISALSAKPDTSSKAVVATTAPTDKTTTKSVFMYLALKDSADTDYKAFNTREQTQLVVGLDTRPSAKTDMMILKAGTAAADGSISGGGAANFKIAGSVAAKPASAWTADDKLTVSLKFTFTPQVITPPASGS